MKKLEKFNSYINIVLIIVALFIEEKIIDKFKETNLKEHEFVLFVSAAVSLIIFFKALEWLVEQAIEKVDWFRELILSDDYIEGTWFDVVEIDGKKFYGIFSITYRDGEITQNGEQIAFDNKPQNSWNTIVSKYENNSLTMIYHVNYFDENRPEQPYGISVCNFSKPTTHRAPVTFSGTFYDMSKNFMTKSFRGFKVTDKEILQRLNNPATRNDALLNLISSPFFNQ